MRRTLAKNVEQSLSGITPKNKPDLKGRVRLVTSESQSGQAVAASMNLRSMCFLALWCSYPSSEATVLAALKIVKCTCSGQGSTEIYFTEKTRGDLGPVFSDWCSLSRVQISCRNMPKFLPRKPFCQYVDDLNVEKGGDDKTSGQKEERNPFSRTWSDDSGSECGHTD